ncbi:hypothetical protein [Spirosoma areae]
MTNRSFFATNTLDLLIKVVVPLCTVMAGVWQFQYGQNVNQEQEFKRRIWEKRLEAYSQIGDITGQLIGAASNARQFDSLSRHFSQIYWGKLPLVEDDSVEIKMKRFKEEVESFKQKEATVEDLETKGYYLMQACQRSLKITKTH